MKKTTLILTFLCLLNAVFAQAHPTLIVADDDVAELKEAMGKYPLWDATVAELEKQMEAQIKQSFDVPVPQDPAGGYTHEKHKANAQIIKKLGMYYQLSGDVAYANYAKALFLEYAAMYPTLDLHPVNKSYARGKLFWQQLNEAVFLCDAIEGYDAIYDVLSAKERQTVEHDFLLKMADFLSVETPYVFNKIHNHGVWAAVAVGMTGFVLNNEELICRAFYGIDERGKPLQPRVDGFGRSPYGFFTQTKALFSPDGYYTEGPYYQRYAMTPFLLFAQSIHQNYPEMQVFDFENRIFIKAVETLIDLTDEKGEFFPVNDHLKGMGLQAPSMVWAMDFLYARTKNPQILSIAEKQGTRSISMGGMEVARALAQGKEEALKLKSKLISDGKNGRSGGLAVMRSKNATTVFKFATQGLNHGHFDRLNLIHYHAGAEILSDYGAARFVNVKAKEGGRYLPENDTYAKQSIAHNTLVVGETSHFGGEYKKAKDVHSDLLFADLENEDVKIVAAQESKAYEGVNMRRVLAQISHPDYAHPILVDVFVADGEQQNVYDMPYHFSGEIIETHFECKAETENLTPLGKAHGYEHLWKIASGTSKTKNAGFTWMQERRFYSLTTLADELTELIFVRNGANDPHFNLRSEPAFILRQKGADKHVFATVVESHGSNNPNTEIVSNQEKMTREITLVRNEDILLLNIFTKAGAKITLLIDLSSREERRTVEVNGDQYELEGAWMLR